MHVFVVPLLSYCSTKTKLHKELEWKGFFEVISKAKLIQLQARALNPNVFHPFDFCFFIFLDAEQNEDVEMASQKPGKVQF